MIPTFVSNKDTTIRHDHLKRLADILKESILMRCALNATTHDKTTNGQIIQLRHYGQRPASPDEVIVQLSDGDHGLDGDGAGVGIEA